MLDTTLNARIQVFLDNFDAALAAGDIDAAVGMFAPECYWRDLVAFTWNIKTMEGPDQGARNARLLPCAREANQLENRRGGKRDRNRWRYRMLDLVRDRRRTRLRPDPAAERSDLDAFNNDGRTEGITKKRRATPGRSELGTASIPGAKTWKELRDEETEQLGAKTQPYVLVIGGGQGGIALGARLRQLGVPTIIVEKNERAGDSWRNRYKSLCLHDPVWYDHLPYIRLPEELAGVLAQGQDRRLAGDVYQGHGAELLDRDRRPNTRAGTTPKRNGTSIVERGGKEITLQAETIGVCDRHVRQAEHAAIQGHGHASRASSTIPRAIQVPTATRARRCVVIGSNNSAHDICAALYEAGVGRDYGAALDHPYRALGFADGMAIGRSLF